ncbi:hypothetical protein GQ53DRAFT_880452 [Thozetella sp. PMI_491]|nr:hypothetical protein GQ53DRAFT_880452 [Thozetella sp. PMI_491]
MAKEEALEKDNGIAYMIIDTHGIARHSSLDTTHTPAQTRQLSLAIRLLNTHTLQLELFKGGPKAAYTILLHIWGPDEINTYYIDKTSSAELSEAINTNVPSKGFNAVGPDLLTLLKRA